MPRIAHGGTLNAISQPEWATVDRSRRAPAWVRARPVTVVGLVLLAVSLAWKANVLSQAYFTEDDFELVGRAFESSPDWSYLTRQHDGQVMPGGLLLAWMLARWATYDWAAAEVVTLVMILAAGLATLRMLRVLFTARPAILVPFAAYLFTPLTMPATTWWAASLNALPLQIALPMAVTSHVLYLRTSRTRHAVAAALWVAFGLAFFLKAAAIPLLLLALTAAYFAPVAGRRGAVLAVTRRSLAWKLQGLVLGLYGILYLATAHTSEVSASAPSVSSLPDLSRLMIGWTFVPGSLGGPWGWSPIGVAGAVADPPLVLRILSWAVAAVVVGCTLARRRGAAWAWLILLGWVLFVDLGPPALGRFSLGGLLLGLEARYLADAATVLALCLGLALIPLDGERAPYRRALRLPPAATRLAAAAVMAAFVAGSLVSVHDLTARLDDNPGRAYVSNARAALDEAPGDVEIYDGALPIDVLIPFYGMYGHTSRVLGPLAETPVRQRMRSQQVFADPLIFDENGRLRPMTVEGVRAAPGPSPGCGFLVQDVPVELPLSGPLFGWTWVVRIGYFASGEGTVEVTLGEGRRKVPVRRGLGAVFFPIPGGGSTLRVRSLTSGVTVCVGDAQVGNAVAKE